MVHDAPSQLQQRFEQFLTILNEIEADPTRRQELRQFRRYLTDVNSSQYLRFIRPLPLHLQQPGHKTSQMYSKWQTWGRKGTFIPDLYETQTEYMGKEKALDVMLTFCEEYITKNSSPSS